MADEYLQNLTVQNRSLRNMFTAMSETLSEDPTVTHSTFIGTFIGYEYIFLNGTYFKF